MSARSDRLKAQLKAQLKTPDGESPGWRERLAALRYLIPLLKLVWQTDALFTALMLVMRLLRAFVPVASLWIGKLIIDTVVAARSGTVNLNHLWKLVVMEIAVVVVGDLLARISALIESLLGDRFSNHTSVRLMEHAAQLDLYHFEDPTFYDQLERARRQTTGRLGLLAKLFTIAQDLLTMASLAAALFVYSPWLLVLLTVATLPSFLGETHFASLEYSMLYRWTPERRQLDYLRYLGASDKTAKEVQMFGLAEWLIERYRSLSERFYEENRKLSIHRAIIASLLSLLGTAGYYGAYVIILNRAVSGLITLGSLTFLAATFSRSRDLIQRLLSGASDVFEQSLYLKDLFDFFEMKPSITTPINARAVAEPMQSGFVFEDVGFQYPGSERWAVRHVNFHLRPGERIAFVGENGAGKTTLTKLIARLYDPTEGRILLDGVDLREYDLTAVRRAISVIFQDFVRYDLRFDENIGVGEISTVQDYLNRSNDSLPNDSLPNSSLSNNGKNNNGKANNGKVNNREVKPVIEESKDLLARSGSSSQSETPDEIVNAAEKSFANTLLPRLAEGYRQMLGRRFEGGVDLSGGEWQKIALARAYMREAQVLILDEPTAALDARAEYEVFIRFSELVGGRMAVIISHRFSTVRMADRIIVLKQGQVIEDGTHNDLLNRNGLYAELFTLQAKGYR